VGAEAGADHRSGMTYSWTLTVSRSWLLLNSSFFEFEEKSTSISEKARGRKEDDQVLSVQPELSGAVR